MARLTPEERAAQALEKSNAAERRNGNLVTVALNHPSGIIMRIYDMEDGYEPVLGGGQRKVQVSVPVGETIRLNGTAVGKGFIPTWRVVAGYALTPGVPKDFWEKWLEQNSRHPLVKNNLIMAYKSIEGADSMAREHRGNRSGLEPIEPDVDVRIPRNKGKRIATDEAQTKMVADLGQRMRAVEDMMAHNPAA